jgi:hypothetical protein
MRCFAGVERSAGAINPPKTFAAAYCDGAHASIGGVRTPAAKSTIAWRDGVLSTPQSVTSLVRAMPCAVPKPGS